MNPAADSITLRLPRCAMEALPTLSEDLTSRMHLLLERNTEGSVSETERAELETLVQMAQFAQLLAMAAQLSASPAIVARLLEQFGQTTLQPVLGPVRSWWGPAVS